MKRVSRTRVRVAVVGWLPVAALVTALFALPGTEAAVPRPLRVEPAARTYGGEKLVISGDMGTGEQRIFLQRGAGGSTGSPVVDPRNGREFTMLTRADGTFSFVFPAPAMDGLFIRVVSARAVTVWHEMHTIHQDAEVGLREVNPGEVPLPRGFAVVNEPFQISVDTVNTDRFGEPSTRPLPGRVVTLERRSGSGWVKTEVAPVTVRSNGWAFFAEQDEKVASSGPEVYRAVLQEWTQDGARIGWFPSLPFYLETVHRPEPVRGLRADLTSSSVKLLWALPADPNRRWIVIVRTGAGGDPDPTKSWQVVATIPGEAETFVDRSVGAGRSYRYAVYTRSKDDVYPRAGSELDVRVPSQRGEG